ncbi:hypothetical protein [Flavobacterium anhuiense]|uniref:hypothetical protein n=1 Tax=Flavobacterium anhuiense TaxID=459526 RepID=UPI000E6BAE43|nr:hypothetical protein [Flavobacterium anhuiense]
MILIDTNSQKIKEAIELHYKGLIVEVKNRIVAEGDRVLTDFFTDSTLDLILRGRPEKLINMQFIFFSKVVPLYNYAEWQSFPRLKRKSRVPRTPAQLALVAKYERVYGQLNRIFDYKKFSAKDNPGYSAYDLADKLDICTCTYCNRLYTKTVIKPSKITRPEFDHWFAKSRYPLLALSFFNLIPSCNTCNSTVKGSSEMKLKTHLHPYIDKPEFKFSYYNRTYGTYGFEIKTMAGTKSQKSIEAFKLKEIYEMHEDEIIDLTKIKAAYSESYLSILAGQYKGLAISEDEIYRLAFGTYNNEDLFDRRPLSRMKRDILAELGIIK